MPVFAGVHVYAFGCVCVFGWGVFGMEVGWRGGTFLVEIKSFFNHF